MPRTPFTEMNCSVAQCAHIIGERWSVLLIRDAMMGITRFEDFRARTGIARNILSSRLDDLVSNGILTRVQYADKPVRHEYVLTEKGMDLWHVLGAMAQWGDKWSAPNGPPVVLEHSACDHQATITPTCSHCGETLDLGTLSLRPGPGAARSA
ncbi:winged helix-turn-helix transcriptional regulator [Gordonia effusa]|nr:helix-turn-helix domain-containing protein [Gordonia effusa]